MIPQGSCVSRRRRLGGPRRQGPKGNTDVALPPIMGQEPGSPTRPEDVG